MRRRLALLRRTAIADFSFDLYKGRTIFLRLCLVNRPADSGKIVAVCHGERLEAESLHTLFDIFRKGDVRTAFNGNIVRIVKNDKLTKTECTRKRECF